MNPAVYSLLSAVHQPSSLCIFAMRLLHSRSQFSLDLNEEIAVDNFAGGGGWSEGYYRATGRHVDHAINHDPLALGMHRINHPKTVHHCEDVFDKDPLEITEGRPAGIAHFSPDCFPAGTLILTREGYRPIEEIEAGDEMLTHLGRWRKVTETSSTVRLLLCLRGHGHPGLLVSAEHPFYARRRRDVWRNATPERPRGCERTLGEADWASASMLDKGWYWATPIVFPALPIPEVRVHQKRNTTVTSDLMWLAGIYLAEGCTYFTEKLPVYRPGH